MADWNSFKLYWVDNLRDQQQDAVWPLLLSHYREKFPNLAQLVHILLVIPVSNAKVERGFSTMRRIKSDWRSSLGEETLDHLMRISIDSPPLTQFEPNQQSKGVSVPQGGQMYSPMDHESENSDSDEHDE